MSVSKHTKGDDSHRIDCFPPPPIDENGRTTFKIWWNGLTPEEQKHALVGKLSEYPGICTWIKLGLP